MKTRTRILTAALLWSLLPFYGASPSGVAAAQQPSAGAAQTNTSSYHALVIGNNEYRALPKLKTAEADAREVAAILKELYGFETRLLLNATRAQIVSALYSYRRTLGPDANLLIYYAGHGYNDRDADKAYWLPVDATRDDESTWIIADEITTGIRVVPARHVLVISDSCYSGTLTRELGGALPPPNAREQFIQRMLSGRSRTLMASGGDEPVADGGGGKHSVFASALMRGLRDIDKQRFTAAELFRFYVEESVAGRAQQTPEYNPLRNSGHESGDFVFVKLKGVVAASPAAPAPRPAPTPYEPRVVADPSARSGWTRYQFGDSPAFSVLLPARPTASATSISSREDPNAVAHLFFADGASAVFGAQRMDGLTNDTERAAEAVRLSMFRNFVAGFADGFAEGLRKQGLDFKVEMGQPRKARIAGRDGFEQDFKYGPLDGRAQIVFAGHSMLCLMAVWSREDGVAADREAFFQSFRIDPPPAR